VSPGPSFAKRMEGRPSVAKGIARQGTCRDGAFRIAHWDGGLLCYRFDGMSFYDKLKFDANGLIPAIIQEQKSGRVLMMAWMNRASLEKTVASGKTWFWSRSRGKFWMKGETSGHTQAVKNIAFDCDGDTLLIQVEQTGAACHEGYQSCFFRSVESTDGAFKITEPQLAESA